MPGKIPLNGGVELSTGVFTGTVKIWTEKRAYYGRLNSYSFIAEIQQGSGTISFQKADVGARGASLDLSGPVTVQEQNDGITVTHSRFKMNLTRSSSGFDGKIVIDYPQFTCPLEGDQVSCQFLETG